MTQRKKSSKTSPDEKKSSVISSGKRKLGDASLDWIKGTTESETIIMGEGEDRQTKSAVVSKETKIGVLKQYVAEDAENKKDTAPAEPPSISDSSSTITKGKRVTPAKKETEQDSEEISREYEVKKEDTPPGKEIKMEKTSLNIPEDSSSIMKKKTETVSQNKIVHSGKTPVSKKKKTDALTDEEAISSSAKRKWIKKSSIGESLKKGSKKASTFIAKPLDSDKTKFRESVSSVIDFSEQPVKAVSAIDRKITQSIKKGFLFGTPRIAGKSIVENIKSTDNRITKSAKKLIDSIFD